MIEPIQYVTEKSRVAPGDNSAEGAAKLQKMFDDAVARQETVYLPGKPNDGRYHGNVLLNNIKGLEIVGHSKHSTIIQSFDKDRPAFKVNGLWFSSLRNIGFGCGQGNANGATFEIDALRPFNVAPNHGNQGNSFYDCMFDAGGIYDGTQSKHAFSMNADSGSYGQGDMHNFFNCYFYRGWRSVYFHRGMNALSNCFWSGNFQQYSKNGIEIEGGSIQCRGTSFQANSQFDQVLNDGWDVYDFRTGAYEAIVLEGCRTESLKFAYINSGHSAAIRDCTQLKALNDWWPNQNYTLKTGVAHNNTLWECTTAHQSGEQFDPNCWKQHDVNIVNAMNGIVENCFWQYGKVWLGHTADESQLQVNKDMEIKYPYKHILVDASNGPVRLHMDPNSPSTGYRQTDRISFIKGDLSDNPVNLWIPYYNNLGIHAYQLTKEHPYVEFKAQGNGTLPTRWYRCG